MIGGGTTALALGVYIGTFLLLFGNVFAEVTEAPMILEKSDLLKTPAYQEATTILTRISAIDRNGSVEEKSGQNVDSDDRKAHDRKDGSRDGSSANGDKSTSRGREENDATDTSSSERTESSSNSDGSGKSRFAEISAESSGKSSSTKVISENHLSFSGTNELTVVAAKSALNDSKQDNKKSLENSTLQESLDHKELNITNLSNAKEKHVNDNLTIMENPESKRAGMKPTKHALSDEFSNNYEENRNVTESIGETMTVESIKDSSLKSSKATSEGAFKLDEKKDEDKMIKPDYKEVISKIEPKKDRNVSSTDLIDDSRGREDMDDFKLEGRDRELFPVHGKQRENFSGSKKDAIIAGTTASEALDLERIGVEGYEDAVSLINDTYVNYKTSTEKKTKGSSKNHPVDVSGSHEKGDPKEEVEVVNNITYQSTLKIVAIANGTANNNSHFNEVTNREESDYIEKKEGVDVKAHDETKATFSSAVNTTIESVDDRKESKSMSESNSQVKLAEVTVRKTAQLEERTSPILESLVPSPIPQGRTIGFSGINEFPSIEMRPTSSTRMDVGLETALVDSVTQNSQNNSSLEKIDYKPYPYVKSNRASFQMTPEAGAKSKNSGVTEETSAYENTIAREESEKKFIVTEPSVVIENSIQQQRLRVKSVNDSTTANPDSASVTIIPITSDGIEPTNETSSVRFNDGAKHANAKDSRSSENKVPSVKEEEKAIAGESYDVTGNGITEVSLTSEAGGRSDGTKVKLHSNGAMESSTLRSLEMLNISKVSSPSTDIQTEPEEAMMIRSTFTITESTIAPSNIDVTTEANKFTSSMTSSVQREKMDAIAATIILENSTELAPKADVTLQSSSNLNQTTGSLSITLKPDESSILPTTSVEFEFVGLTEVVPSASNTTERNNIEGRTFEEHTIPLRITILPTIQDSPTKNNLTVETVRLKSEESTTLAPTSEDGTATTDVNRASIMDNTTIEVRDPPVTRLDITEAQNNPTSTRNEVNAIDLSTVVDAAVTNVTEDPSNDMNSDANVTGTLELNETEFSNTRVTMMASTTNAAKDPVTPFASTSAPSVHWSTLGFTETFEEETTENTQKTLLPDEITSLVKIIIEGTLHEICPHLQDLRQALADVLTNSADKFVSAKQIVIHQNPCLESISSSPTPMDTSLTSILIYVVDEDGKFDAAMTKILPNLYKMSRNERHFPMRIHKFLLVQETDSGNAIAVVVVSSVAFICLVLLAGLLFIMRKRQTRFNYGERCRPVSLDAYSLDSVSAYNSVRRKGTARSSKRSYGNPTFEDSSAIPSHPLNFAGLSSFCNDVSSINEEFSNIPQISAKIDELPPGAEMKNRYANVIPLPETRVPLQKLNNDASTEYINASYVRGPKNATKYYIACQAPIESTVTDFWRMIWEQQCKVVIMLTDLVENGVEKCTEYIPPSEVTDCHRLYGDFQITLKKRETKEKYAISTLHLKNLENNTFREVFHIWYLWPTSGVQSDGAGLIAVLLEARALQRGGPGPIVVHCSPGTGRTGTLIALDLGIRQYEITRTVDVPRVVYTIRRDRAGAVQTKEQYAFIYKALNLYATKLAGGVLEST